MVLQSLGANKMHYGLCENGKYKKREDRVSPLRFIHEIKTKG